MYLFTFYSLAFIPLLLSVSWNYICSYIWPFHFFLYLYECVRMKVSYPELEFIFDNIIRMMSVLLNRTCYRNFVQIRPVA